MLKISQLPVIFDEFIIKEVLTRCYESSVTKVYFIDKYIDLSTSTVVPKETGRHIYIK